MEVDFVKAFQKEAQNVQDKIDHMTIEQMMAVPDFGPSNPFHDLDGQKALILMEGTNYYDYAKEQ